MTTTQRMRRLATVLALAITGALLPTVPAGASDSVRDGKIAIASTSGQIYSLNPDGSDVRRLTHGFSPEWSPDGRQLAIVSLVAGQARIFTIAADGTNRQLLLADLPRFSDDRPRYTPDGQRIVFARCQFQQVEGCAIYSVRLDGTHLTAITQLRHNIYDFWPAISPDGTQIAFTRANAGGVQVQVYVMNADGTHQRAITAPALLAFQPSWSADGTRISFASNCCRLGGDVYDISPEGADLRRLTHTPYPLFSGYPAYAPSGTHIAFLSNRNHPDRCCVDLFVMSADGAHEAPVPIGGISVTDVAWGRAP